MLTRRSFFAAPLALAPVAVSAHAEDDPPLLLLPFEFNEANLHLMPGGIIWLDGETVEVIVESKVSA